jgi:hypothetical protein
MLKNLDKHKITQKILKNKVDVFCLLLQKKYNNEKHFYIDINIKNENKYKNKNYFIYDNLIFILL